MIMGTPSLFELRQRACHSACPLAMLLCLFLTHTASADEAGVSFWLPGQYGSYAAVPSDPGWSLDRKSGV